MKSKVTVIPRKKTVATQVEVKKRKVAGYARVSTEQEEQQNSYQSQLDYYTSYITSRTDWDFAGMYSDEGRSGTSTKKRVGFNSMIEDALDGKIDMIITKSVSRFARNTVDTLSIVRNLKAHNIEVYFEKENIYTLDSKGELLLTILSSLAQEESRSISENTTWGQRKRMADGHGCLGFSRFMGYDKDFVINEEQAKIVRRIFREYLDGNSATKIAKNLTTDGIKTASGKDVWSTSTILSMLRNEKYKGDCLMQKYYIKDFLDHKIIKNNGELQQYYVEAHHEPIITAEAFDKAQQLLKNRSNKSSARYFSSLVVCGDCGSYYGSKLYHSNSKYRKVCYRCNAKYNGVKCSTPTVSEKRLEEIFIKGINQLLVDKDDIMDNLDVLLKLKLDSRISAEDIRQAAIALDSAEAIYRSAIEQRMFPLEKYAHDYDETREQYNSLIESSRTYEQQIAILESFIDDFKSIDGVLDKFDGALMRRIVDHIEINDSTATIHFIENHVTVEL